MLNSGVDWSHHDCNDRVNTFVAELNRFNEILISPGRRSYEISTVVRVLPTIIQQSVVSRLVRAVGFKVHHLERGQPKTILLPTPKGGWKSEKFSQQRMSLRMFTFSVVAASTISLVTCRNKPSSNEVSAANTYASPALKRVIGVPLLAIELLRLPFKPSKETLGVI